MLATDAVADVLQAEDLTSMTALERLRPEWERLWRLSPRATPFQSPHWLLPWCKHIGRGSLASVAMRCAESGELVALAPLYRYTDRQTRLRHLVPIGIGTTDDLDMPVQQGWEQRAIHCLAARLERHANEWDLMEWPQLRPESPLLGLAAPGGCGREIIAGEPSPVLNLETAASGAGPSFPKSMTGNIRYCRRRAARYPSLRYELADDRTIPVFLDALMQLHAKRWAQRGSRGVLDDSAVQAAHREAAPCLQAAGLLRLHGLRLDGEFIALLYCLMDCTPAHERRCYYYLGGFEPGVRALSPGTLLVAHAIECALAEGAIAFDFLRGAEPYKYRWGAMDQPMVTLRLTRVNASPLSARPA